MSVTVRAIGPAVSRTAIERHDAASRHEAHRRPQPGQRVVRGRHAHRPPVSVPMPTTPKFAASAAPVPPEDPPVA